MKLNVIFDIDSCIAKAVRYNSKEEIEGVEDKLGKETTADLLLTAYDYPHFIFPGFYALWEWLYRQGANIMVFSTGIKERNVELIEKFAERSFRTIDKDKRPEVKVFSRDDCFDTEKFRHEDRDQYQSCWFGNLKKKLSGVVVSEEDLPYSLLVDDDRSYVGVGEEKNLIYVCSSFEYYPHTEDDDGFRSFHKAYYTCGLLKKIMAVMEERNLTPNLAAEYVQAELEGEVIKSDFWFPGRKKPEHYVEGLKTLQTIDPTLKFHFKSKYPRSKEWEAV